MLNYNCGKACLCERVHLYNTSSRQRYYTWCVLVFCCFPVWWRFCSKPVPTQTPEITSTTFTTRHGRKASTHWKVNKKKNHVFVCAVAYYTYESQVLNQILWDITICIKICIYVHALFLLCYLFCMFCDKQSVFHVLCFQTHAHTRRQDGTSTHTYTHTHILHPPSLCWVSADIFIWDMYIADIYMAVRFGSTWGQRSVGKRFPDAHWWMG